MSKREDWKILKKIPLQTSLELCKLPLLIIEIDRDKNTIDMDKLNNLIKSTLIKDITNNVNIDNMLFDDCLVLIKYNIDNVQRSTLIRFIIVKIEEDISVSIHLFDEKRAHIMLHFSLINSNKLLFEYINLKTGERTRVDKNSDLLPILSGLAMTVIGFFNILAESDLYAIQKQGKQNRHRPHIKHDKKPWQRSDLVSIVFLNKLPDPDIKHESKGGHHASPRPHQRRGTKVRLMHRRFINHPKYGSTINRKASWVGDKKSIVNGTTYKLWEKHNE